MGTHLRYSDHSLGGSCAEFTLSDVERVARWQKKSRRSRQITIERGALDPPLSMRGIRVIRG
jgi:hypothetical protein